MFYVKLKSLCKILSTKNKKEKEILIKKEIFHYKILILIATVKLNTTVSLQKLLSNLKKNKECNKNYKHNNKSLKWNNNEY